MGLRRFRRKAKKTAGGCCRRYADGQHDMVRSPAVINIPEADEVAPVAPAASVCPNTVHMDIETRLLAETW